MPIGQNRLIKPSSTLINKGEKAVYSFLEELFGWTKHVDEKYV